MYYKPEVSKVNKKRFKTVSPLSGLEQFGLGRDLDVLFVEIQNECSRFDHIDFNNVEELLDERLENDPKYNTGEHAASGKLYRSATSEVLSTDSSSQDQPPHRTYYNRCSGKSFIRILTTSTHME